jgi:alpha-L-fucosidase
MIASIIKNPSGFLGLVLAMSAYAGEPEVVEQTRADGLTELRVVADGKKRATWVVDLKQHHEPATGPNSATKRWESYRLGGFFCFNDNQFTGGEFSTNKDPGIFNPSKLDIPGWAVTMKNAGMKYAVLTARHTSGFLLWDSATSEFDVAASPCRHDVVGEFVKECRRQGIAPGLYYCLWGGAGWMPHANARAIILAQLHELATGYGEIPYFWIDMGFWGPANLTPQEIYDSIKNEQPKAMVILNQHIQDGSSLRYFPTDVVNGEVHLPPDQGHQAYRQIGNKRYYLPFEFEPVSQRIASGTPTPWGAVGAWFTFGAGGNFAPSQPIPAKDLFDWIKRSYDMGAANVLLSLAADQTGSMRADDVRQLEELGKMLRVAGLLTAPGPATRKSQSLALNRPAMASGVWQSNVPQYGPAAAFDGDLLTRWAGAEGTFNGWLEVDLGESRTVSRAIIQEGWDRTRKFVVQYKAGDAWKDAAEGTTIGGKRELKFAAVKAQVFRLKITEAIEVPTIWEFHLF